MTTTLEIVILLVIAAMALGVAARRLGMPYPIALTLGGLALGFAPSILPGLPPVRLDPEIVFIVFLPPILYRAALHMPWHGFRDNWRPIGRLALGLVLFTTAAVAVVAKYLVPSLPWPAAFLLGAIVSPPDAVAATAILHNLNLPRPLVTVIEGESLVNDATALVLYKFALAALMTGVFSARQAVGEFVLVAVGGITVGLALGWVSVWIHRRLHDTLSETLLLMAAPFAAFWAADALGTSGVLAVVSIGLWRAWVSPTVISAETRQRGLALWDAVVFFLNSLIFILIGLQLPPIIQALAPFSWSELIIDAAAISAAMILARVVWVFAVGFLPQWVTARIRGVAPAEQLRATAVVGYIGMRGIVSLAAAMALPLTLADGAPFPARALIVFLTFAVIVTTIVGQGLSLPIVLRRLGYDGALGVDLNEEEGLARAKMAYAAVAEIDRVAERMALPARVIERVRSDFARPLAELEAQADAGHSHDTAAVAEKRRRLRLAAIKAARRRLVKLHREREISDETVETLMRELDFDELRVTRATSVD
ncbi:MAG TPA: Na+/H+ antiporter [Alphaproteobacteria bacterium]|nr:Na+/H+ antiporter [Alphaproteobacteria bacterium]